MNGHGRKEKCIHDGKEVLQHVGKTVTPCNTDLDTLNA